MSDDSAPSTEANAPGLPNLDSTGIRAEYANIVRGLLTPEEIILDFGFNPGSVGVAPEEGAAISSRIVLGFPSAVRLYQLLYALLAKRQEAVQQASEAGQPASKPEVKVFGSADS